MSALVVKNSMPRNIWMLLLGILGTGFAAAQMISPILWWTTLAMAALVVMGWRQSMLRQLDPDADPAELPARTRRIVAETFAELPAGDSTYLLRAVVQPARMLYAAAESNESFSSHVLRDSAELVEVSCNTAAELHRIDQMLDAARPSAADTPAAAVNQALRESRSLFRRRLADAADALGKLYVQSVQRGTMSSDRVAELAAELSAEVSVRKRVSAEMRALLE